MVAYLKDFLLTIFFIFSPLVLYPYIHKFKNSVVLFRSLMTILFSLILIIVMSLPINVDGVIYDFRSVPVVVGSLYGGPIAAIVLFGVLVIYRWVFGNPNNLIYIFAILPAFLLILGTLRKYKPLKTRGKVITAIILCSLMKLLTITIYLAVTNDLNMVVNSLLSTVQTYLVQAIIIGSCVYLIEKLNKYFYMQDEIVKSEKVKIVSDMAAAVAHEIRNPLTAVKGFIQLLGADGIDKTERDYYKKISLEELERANQIISDYLSLAKPETETSDKIDVKEEIQYLSNVLLTFANYNNVQLKIAVDENMHIAGNRFKFRQALVNVGKNAIEAMQDGGTIEIKAQQIDDSLHLSISDTGIGMTPQQVSRLGTPYYSTKEKGTGLGTMVTFAIIKKMNGKIDVQSEPNKGTTCIFIFPLI